MSVLTDLGNFLSAGSQTAATWYNATTYNTPVVPIATSGAGIAAQQAQIQQQAQLNFAAANPTLAGILANPTILIIIGLGLLVLIIYVLKL